MNFLYFIYILSIGIHIVSLFITTLFIFPLEVKEAKVKNGLIKLRIQLLFAGVTIAALNIISIFALSSRFFLSGDLVRYITVLLVLSHSIGFLIFSLIKLNIYKSQYSTENLRLHKKIEDIEKNELKDPDYYK